MTKYQKWVTKNYFYFFYLWKMESDCDFWAYCINQEEYDNVLQEMARMQQYGWNYNSEINWQDIGSVFLTWKRMRELNSNQ